MVLIYKLRSATVVVIFSLSITEYVRDTRIEYQDGSLFMR